MKLKLLTTLATALLAAGCATHPAPQAEAAHVAALDTARFRAVVVESVRIAPEAGMLSASSTPRWWIPSPLRCVRPRLPLTSCACRSR
jgi:hypothetical protein